MLSIILSVFVFFICLYPLFRSIFTIKRHKRVFKEYLELVEIITDFFKDGSNQSRYNSELFIFMNIISDFKNIDDIEKIKDKCDILTETFSPIT